MRTIPGNVRTDEVCPAAFDSITFAHIGLNASKRGAGSCGGVCSTCGDPRVMFVDVSPPACTRVAGAQVARAVRRHGRGDGLSPWVCEQRMRKSKAARDQRRARDSSGAAEEVRARGQRLMDMNIYSPKYAVYAYDTGKCSHGQGRSTLTYLIQLHS